MKNAPERLSRRIGEVFDENQRNYFFDFPIRKSKKAKKR
jgi:hypothetical protein